MQPAETSAKAGLHMNSLVDIWCTPPISTPNSPNENQNLKVFIL
jgi:hypothetical protein